MAMLLRKVWGSVLSRAGAAGGPDPAECCYGGSLGALDDVPADVLAQILRLLGPADAARSGAVCRAWRVLASDNGLWAFFLRLGPEPWDLVVFAETHLAAGPVSHPWLYYDSSQQLSFKQIYGLRAVVPGSVIVDGGSGYCKYGWSKYAAPSGRRATFLEFGNIESPMYARLRHFFSTIYTRLSSCEQDHSAFPWLMLSIHSYGISVEGRRVKIGAIINDLFRKRTKFEGKSVITFLQIGTRIFVPSASDESRAVRYVVLM